MSRYLIDGFNNLNNDQQMPFGPHTVLRCLRQIYGMKAAAREFFNVFSEHLRSKCGFSQLESDCCVFIKYVKDGKNVPVQKISEIGRKGYDQVMILCLWVDDCMCAFSDQCLLDQLLDSFKGVFEYRDEGAWRYMLGMNIKFQNHVNGQFEVSLSHASYMRKLLAQHKEHFTQHAVTVPCKKANPFLSKDDCPKTEAEVANMKTRYTVYRSALGMLVHVTNWTHPELAYVVSVASMFMSNPGEVHFNFLMVVLQYCLGAVDRALLFKPWLESVAQWFGYSDSDYAADVSRRSRTGYAWYFCGNLISWCSKLQHSVSLSTAESEYQALTAAAQEFIWLQRLFTEMGLCTVVKPLLYSDNKACIAIANNPVMHKYTKHIDVRLHFIRELLQRDVLEVKYIETQLNVADIFTKGLAKQLFQRFRDYLFGIRPAGPVSLDKSQILNDLSEFIQFDDYDLVSDGVRAISNIFSQFVM